MGQPGQCHQQERQSGFDPINKQGRLEQSGRPIFCFCRRPTTEEWGFMGRLAINRPIEKLGSFCCFEKLQKKMQFCQKMGSFWL